MEDVSSTYTSRFLTFLDQNMTLLIVLLLGATLLLRLKYMTVNAGLWWDESDYLRLAKHYAFGLQDIAAPYRERGMAMFYGVLYKLGANEWFIRFVEQLLSVASVYFVYLIGKELYSRKVGLVAALMLAVLWVHIFWATRISGELFTMALWTIAAYLFWKGYVKKESMWYVVVAAMLVGFGTYAYSSMGLSLFFFLAFVLITEKLNFLKNKRFWYAAVAAMLIVGPFMLYSYSNFDHIYPRFQRTVQADWKPLSEGQFSKSGISPVTLFFSYWVALPGFLSWPFFIALIIGAGIIVFELAVGFDLLLKGKDPRLKRDLYIFLWALDVLVMFSIVYTTTNFEFDPRFLVPMYPAAFLIASKGLFKGYDILKKYNKDVAVIAVAAILVWGTYSNLAVADKAIGAKKDTYIGEKEAGLWIKEHTTGEDAVLVCNQEVVFGYYTERIMGGFGSNVSLADRLIEEMHPKYAVLDIYHPDCAFNLQEESSHKLDVAYVTFVDAEKTQPAVVVYKVVY